MDLKIAISGLPGSYSEEAVKNTFGHNKPIIYCTSFIQALEKIEDIDVQAAVLPRQTSHAGFVEEFKNTVNEEYYYIDDTINLFINHCLLALPNTKIHEINYVVSHIKAIEECSNYIKEKGFNFETTNNTAKGLKKIVTENLKYAAGIAAKGAAETYNLCVVEENIENYTNNETQFCIIKKR